MSVSTQEMPMEGAETAPVQRRVVETEIRLPTLEELALPKVDLKPVRDVAGEILLTGLGLGVLLVRGVIRAVNAAHEAGKQELENPSAVTKAVLNLVHREEGPTAAKEIRISVPVLPLADYDARSGEDIVEHLEGLSDAQMRVLREYETEHQARAEVLDALDRRLTAG